MFIATVKWAGLATLLLLAKPTYACGLEEVMSGNCTDDIVRAEQDDDRAAIYRPNTWVRWSDLNTILTNEGRLALNVCGYLTDAQGYGGTRFSAVNKRWSQLMSDVELIAADWETASLTTNGQVRSSRIDFVFRDTEGEFRQCENYPYSHIRVLFTSSNYLTALGVASMHHSKIKFPSMRLATELERWKVVHEFGHALGFIHEMRHQDWSECGQAFSVDKFLGIFGWLKYANTRAGARQFIEDAIDGADFKDEGVERTDEFDNQSVMTYEIGAEYFPPGFEGCALSPSSSPTDSDTNEFLDIYRLP